MKNQIFSILSTISLLATSVSWADYPGVVTADGPLAYYRFEEAVGATTLVDSSGNGLDIDYSAPIGTTQIGEPGAIGLAALFNADGSLLTPLVLDPSLGDFSMEAIIRADSPGAAGTVVLANQDGTAGPGRSRPTLAGQLFYPGEPQLTEALITYLSPMTKARSPEALIRPLGFLSMVRRLPLGSLLLSRPMGGGSLGHIKAKPANFLAASLTRLPFTTSGWMILMAMVTFQIPGCRLTSRNTWRILRP